jgi:hypothetical protein
MVDQDDASSSRFSVARRPLAARGARAAIGQSCPLLGDAKCLMQIVCFFFA